MDSKIRIGKKLLPILVLGFTIGFVLSLGCGDDNGINRAPVLSQIGDKVLYEHETLHIILRASDPDGDNLSYSSVDLPPGAEFEDDPCPCCIVSFLWVPELGQAGTYEVTFSVSDGELSDSETITITVNKVRNIGAAHTGIYPTIASNYEGDCIVLCEGPMIPMIINGLPAPECREFDLLLLQRNNTVFGIGTGTISIDGSFTTNYFFATQEIGPLTIQISGTGNISDDTIEGNISLEYEYEAEECSWSFDYLGPIPGHNITITVNGFSEYYYLFNVHVYAFVIKGWEGDLPILGGLGGGTLAADGSVIIRVRPELPDGEYALWMVVDVDANIEDKIYLIVSGELPLSAGDWYVDEYNFDVNGGVGSVTLDKVDFAEMPP